VDRFDRAHISMVLRLCKGNRERAARELDISHTPLILIIENSASTGAVSRGRPVAPQHLDPPPT